MQDAVTPGAVAAPGQSVAPLTAWRRIVALLNRLNRSAVLPDLAASDYLVAQKAAET